MQHILVCDDEEDIVAALKIYLEADGYCVHAAYTGADALKIVREEPVQLALMDIMMPGMDGITAMAKLREFSNIPVILLTAKSEDSDKILGLSVGADDYITKPFNPVEVLARVKSQLRRFLQLGAAVKAPSVGSSSTMTPSASRSTASRSRSRRRNTTFSTISCSTPARSIRPRSSTVPCGTRPRSGSTTPWRYTSAICARSWRSTRPTPAT